LLISRPRIVTPPDTLLLDALQDVMEKSGGQSG
jgi:hypothetical protein